MGRVSVAVRFGVITLAILLIWIPSASSSAGGEPVDWNSRGTLPPYTADDWRVGPFVNADPDPYLEQFLHQEPGRALQLRDHDGRILWTKTDGVGFMGVNYGIYSDSPTGQIPASIDWNADGSLDLIWYGVDHTLYLLNASNGATLGRVTTTETFLAVVGDIDGNGKPDTLAGTFETQGQRFALVEGAQEKWSIAFPGGQPKTSEFLVGDFDGDASPEVVLTHNDGLRRVETSSGTLKAESNTRCENGFAKPPVEIAQVFLLACVGYDETGSLVNLVSLRDFSVTHTTRLTSGQRLVGLTNSSPSDPWALLVDSVCRLQALNLTSNAIQWDALLPTNDCWGFHATNPEQNEAYVGRYAVQLSTGQLLGETSWGSRQGWLRQADDDEALEFLSAGSYGSVIFGYDGPRGSLLTSPSSNCCPSSNASMPSPSSTNPSRTDQDRLISPRIPGPAFVAVAVVLAGLGMYLRARSGKS